MSVFDYLINDIQIIVYRYIHLAKYTQCIQQYIVEYQQYWNPKTMVFYSEDPDIHVMWRRLDTGRCGYFIYPLRGSGVKCYNLPRNY